LSSTVQSRLRNRPMRKWCCGTHGRDAWSSGVGHRFRDLAVKVRSSVLSRYLTRSFQHVANLSKTAAPSGIVADSPFKSRNGNFLLFADIALSISITGVGHA
jgi:hypothetical protein